MRTSNRWRNSVALGVCGIFLASTAHAQSIAIKNSETVAIGSVYWIANCKSILKSFAGIDVLSGPPEVTLSLKRGMVRASRQNCANPVKGATVMATAKGIKAQSSSALNYRVRYNTLDGERQSSHTVHINLYP